MEEDIIYITKREPLSDSKDCSDCDLFTPWGELDASSLLERSDSTSQVDGVNGTHAIPLIRRAGKNKNVKEGAIMCQDGITIEFNSYPYPTNEQLAKVWKQWYAGLGSSNIPQVAGSKIYDFNPFDRSDQASYYQLKSINAFQLRAGRGAFTNRAVSVEHILEWQVLLNFIESDEKRCKHIVKHFKDDVDIDTVWDVKDASGQSSNKGVKWTERAIDWVAHQYPGSKTSRSLFSYEFVSFHDGVNGREERVYQVPDCIYLLVTDYGQLWSEGSSGGNKKGPGVSKKPDLVSDDKWTRWTEKNQYQAVSPSKTGSKRPSKTWTLSPNNEGKCQAVVALRDIIGVYRYRSYPEVQEIMTAQIDRIGTAFKYLEQGPLKKPGGYVPMATSLESQWNTHMKARYASVISEIESTMKTLSADLGKAKVKRSWLSRLKRGTGSSAGPLCGQEKDKQKMNDRINLLIKEYEAVKGKWKNPMP